MSKTKKSENTEPVNDKSLVRNVLKLKYGKAAQEEEEQAQENMDDSSENTEPTKSRRSLSMR